MRIIAFITFSADIHKILEHIGVDPEAPRIAPARGPPLWDECGAPESQEQDEGVELSRTGIWQTNHRPSTPTISAPLGEFAAMGNGSRRLRRGRDVFFGRPARGLG